jgi:hypothetical protein
MGIADLKFDTAKAFALISIDINAMQRLSENPKDQVWLRRFGVNLENFTPVIAEEIELGQWIKILQFYAGKARYKPARRVLAEMKKMLKTSSSQLKLTELGSRLSG